MEITETREPEQGTVVLDVESLTITYVAGKRVTLENPTKMESHEVLRILCEHLAESLKGSDSRKQLLLGCAVRIVTTNMTDNLSVFRAEREQKEANWFTGLGNISRN